MPLSALEKTIQRKPFNVLLTKKTTNMRIILNVKYDKDKKKKNWCQFSDK